MAEIRHLKYRHDVIIFCRGWSDLDKISHVDWYRMTCRLRWCVEMETRCRIPLYMADVCANSMACHPRAMYHIAGCCHLVNSLSRFQSHMPHCRVQSPDEINVVIVPHCSVYKNSIRHIENRFSPYFIFLDFDERRLSYRLRYACFVLRLILNLQACLSLVKL